MSAVSHNSESEFHEKSRGASLTWKDKDPLIYAIYDTYDMVVDWNEEINRFEIIQKSGWGFKKFLLKSEKPGLKEWIRIPQPSRNP